MPTRLRLLALALLLLTGARLSADPTAPLPDLTALQKKLADKRHPLTWAFTGDSITQGAKWLGVERAYPEVIQEHVRWTLGRRRDLFINSGISGERTKGPAGRLRMAGAAFPA